MSHIIVYVSRSTDASDNVQRASQWGSPLSGKSGNTPELLMDLSDDEIVEWCVGLASRRERCRADGQGFGSWMLSNAQSNGYRELGLRGFSVEAIDDMIRERIVPDIAG